MSDFSPASQIERARRCSTGRPCNIRLSWRSPLVERPSLGIFFCVNVFVSVSLMCCAPNLGSERTGRRAGAAAKMREPAAVGRRAATVVAECTLSERSLQLLAWDDLSQEITLEPGTSRSGARWWAFRSVVVIFDFSGVNFTRSANGMESRRSLLPLRSSSFFFACSMSRHLWSSSCLCASRSLARSRARCLTLASSAAHAARRRACPCGPISRTLTHSGSSPESQGDGKGIGFHFRQS